MKSPISKYFRQGELTLHLSVMGVSYERTVSLDGKVDCYQECRKVRAVCAAGLHNPAAPLARLFNLLPFPSPHRGW